MVMGAIAMGFEATVLIVASVMIVVMLSSLILAYLNPPRIVYFEVVPRTVKEGRTVTISVKVEGFFLRSVKARILNPDGSGVPIELKRVDDLYYGTWRAASPFEVYRVEVVASSLTTTITQMRYMKVVEDLGSQVIAVLIGLDDQLNAWRGSRDFFPVYIREVLLHAGISFETIGKSNLSSLIPYRILILPYNVSFTGSERERITEFVASGGALIGIGGASGLNAVFGVGEAEGVLEEGYVTVVNETHPITSNLDSSLHVVGRIPLYPLEGGCALAKVRGPSGEELDYPSIVLKRHLNGLAILIAPDLLSSIVNIQQGKPITEDGPWPVNDDILKTDDGILLNYTTDRETVLGHKVFLKPIADEEREIILKSILYASWDRGIPIPILWYWPGDVLAVALYSHDSDGGDELKARCLLSNMSALGVESTWCILPGEGYSSEFYSLLKEHGYEIALHYDALRHPWSETEFYSQYTAVSSETDVALVSNKNHYLRWEQWTEFYRWCERNGIQVDQTKGPSKVHNFGFLYGSSHPYFPIDDWEHQNRFLDVLEITLQDQEMWRSWPDREVLAVLNNFTYQAYKHYGVVHHLFHPAHIHRAYRVLNATVQFIRSLPGMRTWTSKQINDWERSRRGVAFEHLNLSERRLRFYISSVEDLDEATIMILVPKGFRPESGWSIKVNNSEVEWKTIKIYSFEFIRFTTGIKGVMPVEVQLKTRD